VIPGLIAVTFVWVWKTSEALEPSTHLQRPTSIDPSTGVETPVRFPIDSLAPKPLLQLEFARRASDVEGVVGGPTRRAREENIARLQEANRIDTWQFVPAYCALLIAVTLLIASGSGRHAIAVLAAGLVMVIVIGGADLIENRGIAGALTKLSNGQELGSADVARIWSPAVVKWTLLGMLPAALGAVTWLHRGWRRVLTPLLLATAAAILGPLGRHFVHRLWA
jgi:hypothetical protein